MRRPLYSTQVPKAKCNFHSDSQSLPRKRQGIFPQVQRLYVQPARVYQPIASACIEKKRWEVAYSFTQIASLLPETGLHSGAGQSQPHLLYKATILFIMAV